MSEDKKIIARTENLSVVFDDSQNRIEYGDIEIEAGDFILIRGKNGSGKSTFLKLFKPNQCTYFDRFGKLFYNDGDLTEKSIFDYTEEEKSELNRKIIEIGQEETFESWASAYNVIANPALRAVKYSKDFSAEEKREKYALIDKKIKEYFDKYIEKSFFGKIGSKKNYFIFKYKNANKWSGGQKKMIHLLSGIVKAAVVDSKLIIMDEPLNNLDGYNKSVLNKIITELRKERELAILMVTHCHVFDGVNKTLTINETAGAVKASVERTAAEPHRDCIENFSEVTVK